MLVPQQWETASMWIVGWLLLTYSIAFIASILMVALLHALGAF